MRGRDRWEAAQRAKILLRSGNTYRMVAETLGREGLYDGAQAAPSTSYVTSLMRDYDDLAAKWAPLDRVVIDQVREVLAEPLDYGESRDGWDQDRSECFEPGFNAADDRREFLKRWIGDTFTPDPFYFHPRSDTRLVAGAGDFHGQPDPYVLAALVAARADIYVIGGDSTDQQYASGHKAQSRAERLRRKRATVRDDTAAMRAALQTLLNETPGKLAIMLGNHDQWTQRQAMEWLPDYALELFADPLDLLLVNLGPRVERVHHANGFHYPNGTSVDTLPETGFMYVLGDVLFSHKNYTAKHPGEAVKKLYLDFFTEWADPLQVSHVHVLVQFHGHKRAMSSRAGGWRTLIEPGMAGSAAVEGYKLDYMARWQPSVQGFVLLEQYLEDGEWKTDAASIDLVAPRIGRSTGVRDRPWRGGEHTSDHQAPAQESGDECDDEVQA